MQYLGSKTEGRHTADFIRSEANGFRSRETVTIADSSAVLEPGTVLGIVTASGKYAPIEIGASDGTQNSVAVLYARVNVDGADAKGVVVIRDAEMIAGQLIWPGGITDNEKAAEVAKLATSGLVAR